MDRANRLPEGISEFKAANDNQPEKRQKPREINDWEKTISSAIENMKAICKSLPQADKTEIEKEVILLHDKMPAYVVSEASGASLESMQSNPARARALLKVVRQIALDFK